MKATRFKHHTLLALSALGSVSLLPGCSEAPGSPEVSPGESFEPKRLGVRIVSAESLPDYPTDFVFLPRKAEAASEELLLLDKVGAVLHYRLEDDTLALLGRFEIPEVEAPTDCGLISIALDPAFEQNRLFYLGYCTSKTSSGVYRYEFDESAYVEIPNTRGVILEVEEPRASQAWHNVGWMEFDAQGALCTQFGDKTIRSNSQDKSKTLGSVVRLLPELHGDGYRVPSGNPGAEDPAKADIGYAWGLRSPWRGGFDELGRIWIGDVGEAAAEEVNVLSAPDQNFGWPNVEGSCEKDCEEVTDPSFWYTRDSSDPYLVEDEDALPSSVRVVWVASQYDATGQDRYHGLLTRRVLFGDTCAGFVRGGWVDEGGVVVEDVPLGHAGRVAAVRQSADGYLYATRLTHCLSERAGTGSFVRFFPSD